jgi:hypothetical protein
MKRRLGTIDGEYSDARSRDGPTNDVEVISRMPDHVGQSAGGRDVATIQAKPLR